MANTKVTMAEEGDENPWTTITDANDLTLPENLKSINVTQLAEPMDNQICQAQINNQPMIMPNFGDNIINKAHTARRQLQMGTSLAKLLDKLNVEQVVGADAQEQTAFNEEKCKFKPSLQETKEQTNPELTKPNYPKITLTYPAWTNQQILY